MNRICIIGGGAAGMAAALSAAQTNPHAQVTILEGLDRVGKKILATGNGRCNLTNECISPVHYHTRQPQRLAQLLQDMPVSRTLDFFQSLGLYCITEEMGRIYPYCRQASMVLDVLLLALRRANIQVICNCKVNRLLPQKKSWLIQTEQGQEFHADAVILTTGGKAAPKQGSTGSGYPMAARLGHHYTKLYPCLVPLQCDGAILKGLKGIRIHCGATLFAGKQKLTEELGEIQLTEYGLSGIPAFQLSCHMENFTAGADYSVSLDLFPDWSYDALRTCIQQRIRQYPQDTLETCLLGLINKRVLFAVWKTLALGALSRTARSLTKRELDQLISACKSWKFPVTGTLTWNHAQVTGGGIALDEIHDDFSSIYQLGLFFAGEILDVVGDCGGYNLHWAWCSGMAAGTAAAQL